MLFIPNVAVEVIILPERARATQDLVSYPGGVAFPSFQDFSQGHVPNFYQSVDVIWHDDPRHETVPYAIVVPQVFLQDLGDAWVTQVTSPITEVKIAFELAPLFQ